MGRQIESCTSLDIAQKTASNLGMDSCLQEGDTASDILYRLWSLFSDGLDENEAHEVVTGEYTNMEKLYA